VKRLHVTLPTFYIKAEDEGDATMEALRIVGCSLMMKADRELPSSDLGLFTVESIEVRRT